MNYRQRTYYSASQRAEIWDRWQLWESMSSIGRVTAGAVLTRSGKGRSSNGQKKKVSLLVGKIFDETGGGLTPSHTKTASGRRLRYYVSHRLIRSSGPKDPGGWRLPALELETLVADLVRKHLRVPVVQANIVSDATTENIASVALQMTEITGGEASADDETNKALLGLIERVQIAPGKILISIEAKAIAERLAVEQERIFHQVLSLEAGFRHRKRGVETKLILADASGTRDETLFRNIALAHRYFDMIRSGKLTPKLPKLKTPQNDVSSILSSWRFWLRISFGASGKVGTRRA